MSKYIIFTLASIILSGCFGSRVGEPIIDKVAYIEQVKRYTNSDSIEYAIELGGTGTSFGSVHRPSIIPSNYRIYETIYVKNPYGTISASEISVSGRSGYKKTGTVTFTDNNHIIVNLKFLHYSRDGSSEYRSFELNGDYELRGKQK